MSLLVYGGVLPEWPGGSEVHGQKMTSRYVGTLAHAPPRPELQSRGGGGVIGHGGAWWGAAGRGVAGRSWAEPLNLRKRHTSRAANPSYRGFSQGLNS